jgi:hypothetical protein
MSFGTFDYFNNSYGAMDEAATNGYFWGGMAFGVASQLYMGNVFGVAAGGGAGVTNASRALYATSRAYQGYMIAGDIIGVGQSGYHLGNGTFSAMDTLGFLPTIGWAGAAFRGRSLSLSAGWAVAALRKIRGTSPRSAAFGALDLIEDADDAFFKVISRRPKWDVDPNGYFDVTGHGGPQRMRLGREQMPISAEDLADILRAEPGYNSQDIRLLTCHAAYGENSFAQQLADLMGVNVKAAPGWLLPSETGAHKIYGTLLNSDGSLIPHANVYELLDWVVKRPGRG